jgi:S1-C subfamily serine protease
LEEGKLLRAYLGVRYTAITDDFAASHKLSVVRGAYIIPSTPGEPSVLPGSPAKKAGLRDKDIIVKVDDVEINEKNSLTSVIAQKKVGDKVVLEVIRGNKTLSVEVTLEAMPQ